MRINVFLQFAGCIAVGALLGGCSAFDFTIPSKKVEYKSAGKLPTLEVPPDLTKPSADDRYNVPDRRKDVTANQFKMDSEMRQVNTQSNAVLPEQSDARVERAGTQRWLVVKGEPAAVWPVVKDFWQETGLLINSEDPVAGVMETDWAEKRNVVPDGAVRGFLSRILDSTYSTSERDKYRTRIERGANGTTEIYISHRAMEEIFITEGKDQTRWQPRKADPDLEAQMLQRLMVRFGVQQERAKQQVAASKEAPRASMASQSGGILTINEQFDRAWRRVGLALDRVGFTVEDRDRAKGLYFVRYIDPDGDMKAKDSKGWFSWLSFGGSSKKSEQYQIAVRDMQDTSQVNVLSKEGREDKSATAGRILTLLQDQLK